MADGGRAEFVEQVRKEKKAWFGRRYRRQGRGNHEVRGSCDHGRIADGIARGPNRCTIISPGAIDSELKHGSSDEASLENILSFYKIAIPADSVARAIAYAIEQPADVEIDEIVSRPSAQDF